MFKTRKQESEDQDEEEEEEEEEAVDSRGNALTGAFSFLFDFMSGRRFVAIRTKSGLFVHSRRYIINITLQASDISFSHHFVEI